MLVVVAALLVEGSRVLAARRHEPAGWEFPGGKVEAGESEPDAVTRECAEELGLRLRATDLVGEARDTGVTLRLWAVAAPHDAPQPLDHAELRWVEVEDLEDLGWLPLDRALLPAVRAHLDAAATGPR